MLGCFSRHRRKSMHPNAPMVSAPHLAAASLYSSSSHSSGGTVVYNSLYNSLFTRSDSAAGAAAIASGSEETPHLTAKSSTFSSSQLAVPADPADPADETDRELSSAIASRRLFPASPGRSNSIIDSVVVGPLGGIAVPTYSPDPYWDFRRSMEEMVAVLEIDATTQKGGALLHELLLCYLSLNRKQAHRYIVSAFADLLLTLVGAAGV